MTRTPQKPIRIIVLKGVCLYHVQVENVEEKQINQHKVHLIWQAYGKTKTCQLLQRVRIMGWGLTLLLCKRRSLKPNPLVDLFIRPI